MSTTSDEIRADVKGILATVWKTREGAVIPDASDVRLGNDAVQLQGTVLYADLVDSSGLVNQYKDWFAAEVYKAYLLAAAKVVRSQGGQITAFDGDRLMAVFIGGAKNSSAARAALKINWAVKNVVNPAIKNAYPDTSYKVRQVVGIDAGPLFVARTGIRGSNDLVWVGSAANYAAKLCSLRSGSDSSLITERVFNRLLDDAKYGGSPKQLMWNKDIWPETGQVIYKSGWTWEP